MPLADQDAGVELHIHPPQRAPCCHVHTKGSPADHRSRPADFRRILCGNHNLADLCSLGIAGLLLTDQQLCCDLRCVAATTDPAAALDKPPPWTSGKNTCMRTFLGADQQLLRKCMHQSWIPTQHTDCAVNATHPCSSANEVPAPQHVCTALACDSQWCQTVNSGHTQLDVSICT